MENVHQELVPDPFLTLVNSLKCQSMQKTLLKNTIFWEDSQKTFEKLTWFFSIASSSFCGYDYEKQKGCGFLLGCKTYLEKLLF